MDFVSNRLTDYYAEEIYPVAKINTIAVTTKMTIEDIDRCTQRLQLKLTITFRWNIL